MGINMKNILPIITVVILVLSGLGASAISSNSMHNSISSDIHLTDHISFSHPIVEDYNSKYIDVRFKDTSSYLMKPGKPVLPKVVKTIELDFGVRDVKVDIVPESIIKYTIDKEIRPANIPLPLLSNIDTTELEYERNIATYSSNELFPSTWFTYSVGCGLNSINNHVTYVAIQITPIRYNPTERTLYRIEDAEIKISYKEPIINLLSTSNSYDMVIIAPKKFSNILQKLTEHKTAYGLNTIIKTTEDIYDEYNGVDKPEQIKYFIKDAIETGDVTYVLLVGGLKSLIWSTPRDDKNQGTKGWHVPVRYNNLFDDPEHPLLATDFFDPGVITDLYYSDIYEAEGNFSSWDPNKDGIFAAMGRPGIENDSYLDLLPDVILGRLACRNKREVKNMVNKIIAYESEICDPSWFKKMIVVSGDGFLDQEDLDIQWDVNGLPDGDYTIYGQSTNPEKSYGPIEIINVTLDRTVESNISFNHDDHLKITTYPNSPIAEITSPSEGDILGNTDYFYEPTEGEAYCNFFTGWANVSYMSGIMHIRGKAYDPKPYGNVTNIHIWIKNSDGEIIFSQWKNNTEMYYEGEWVTGERFLRGKGGALYYMPSDFEKEILWASNGLLTGQKDVITSLSKGAGFVFLSGHGSPRVWADHYPGVPGNRRYGSVTGLLTIDPYGGPPFIPVERISNFNKPFIMVVGGCHNSQFNVSLIPSLLDYKLGLSLWTYGAPAPECFSWWLTRLKNRGAIASIGNTGLGYGMLGGDCTISGLDGGISLEFFRQYGEQGHRILGNAYLQTQTYYHNHFDMEEDDHIKSLQQWVLLGDPSLMIGGY
jgi:hypothetical protein